jgi:mannan endo-1,6-alpha-mannosidase
MSAAERKFPDPPAKQPQWLALAQAVFNLQAGRWDTGTCGGGLKWQIFPFNNGYTYKNTISNGCFFNLASRLARYTGNSTYSNWATKSWDWTAGVGLMSKSYQFFDGSETTRYPNCTNYDRIQWSYNAGVFMHGTANMYNLTGDKIWLDRLNNILDSSDVFFHPNVTNVMWEVACEGVHLCNNDQRSFKAYLSRWMAASMQLVPEIADKVTPKLQASAIGAAQSCSGGTDGVTCGLTWWTTGWDGLYGPGEQMSAMEVIQGLLVKVDPAKGAQVPVTNSTGGTSKGGKCLLLILRNAHILTKSQTQAPARRARKSLQIST